MDILDPRKWGEAIAGWLEEKIVVLILYMIDHLLNALTNPPSLLGTDIVSYLYGNMYGALPVLVYAASYFAILMAIISRRRIRSLGQFFIIVVAVLFLNGFWFAFIEWVHGTGTSLTAAIDFGDESVGGSTIDIPLGMNIPATILGVTLLISPTAILFGISMLYEMINHTINFWFLPVLVFYALGEGAKKVVKLMISVGLVSMVFGRMAMKFFIEFGQSMANSLAENDPFVLLFAMNTAFWLAILAQPFLVWACYKGVSHVISKANGRMWIRGGDINTANKSPQKISHDVNQQHQLSLRSQGNRSGSDAPQKPVRVEVAQHRLTTGEQMKLSTKQSAVKVGTGWVAKAAASNPKTILLVPVVNRMGQGIEDSIDNKAYRKSVEKNPEGEV